MMRSTERLLLGCGLLVAAGGVAALVALWDYINWSQVVLASPVIAALIVAAKLARGKPVDKRSGPTLTWHDDGIISWLADGATGGRSGPIVDLRQVGWIAWDLNLFVPGESAERLAFYTKDPQLEMTVFGCSARDPSATELGTVSFRNLRRSPEVLDALTRWVIRYGVGGNVALPALEPIRGQLPPLAPGTTIQGRTVCYQPPSRRPPASNEGTVTMGAATLTAARPLLMNGIQEVSLGHVTQLTYLTWRSLPPAKKVSMSVALALLTLLLAVSVHPVWGLWAPVCVAAMLLLPLAMIAGVWANMHPRNGWVVGLFSAAGTQIVRQDGVHWRLTDHFAWVRGQGAARQFRQQAFSELARQADLFQVAITMDTAVITLKDRYLEDMPGLVLLRESTGAAGETVYQLIRHPQQPTSANEGAR